MNSDSLLNNKVNSVIELYSRGQISEALESIETLISKNPQESLLHNISGVCLKSIGQLEKAVQSFQSAIDLKPDFADAHYNLALTHQELNHLDAAVESYKETLAIQINYSKAHNNLGTIYRELGQMDEAIKSYEKAIKIQPDFAEAFNNLGNALNESDRSDDAIKAYERALVIKPDYFEVHNNLGNILHELGHYDKAIMFYDQAISIDPNFADAHNNLGISLNEHNQFDYAIKSFERAIAINPGYYEAHNNLGITLNKIHEFEEAVKCYSKAIAINPLYAEAHYNLGVSLNELGEAEKAIKHIKQAIVINPDYADAHCDLGIIFQELGQSEAAFNSYVNALAIEPDNTHFHRNLASIKYYKEGDTQFAHMQSLLSSTSLGVSDRINLCFALAKSYKDLGKKSELFKVLNEGNWLRKEELNYSIDSDLKKHSSYKKLFKLDIKITAPYKPINIKPIFIVGMPRSGTTLVEQIISSHKRIHGGGELSKLDSYIDSIINENLTPNDILSEKNFFSIREMYSNDLSSLNISEDIMTDKMPTNFENLGFILKAFPEAKIIHLKRDVMAVCWSIYQRYFPAEGIGFPYDMEDLAKFYKSYTSLMAFWHDLFPKQIYDISYEELTTNQEDETRKLLEYCELEWDQNCLDFHTNNRAIKTASSLQVKEKMYQGSSEAWKKYKVELKPLIDSLGYKK